MTDRTEYMRLYKLKRREEWKALHPPPARPPLSPRQKEVLEWAARGKTAIEIGMILRLTYATVCCHRKEAVHKLGAVTLPQATALGVASGVITL